MVAAVEKECVPIECQEVEYAYDVIEGRVYFGPDLETVQDFAAYWNGYVEMQGIDGEILSYHAVIDDYKPLL